MGKLTKINTDSEFYTGDNPEFSGGGRAEQREAKSQVSFPTVMVY